MVFKWSVTVLKGNLSEQVQVILQYITRLYEKRSVFFPAISAALPTLERKVKFPFTMRRNFDTISLLAKEEIYQAFLLS